jgi:anaerobic C4-dicarboxylate transporter DcuA
LVAYKKGKNLSEDPIFLEKMKDPAFALSIDSLSDPTGKVLKKGAKSSVVLFCAAIALVVFAGAFPEWLPHFAEGSANYMVKANGTLTMVSVISIVTLSISAAIMGITRTSAASVAKTSLFTAMGVAVVSVFGVVWMASTFILHYKETIQVALGDITAAAPWTFTFAILLMAMLIFSQAATTKAMMPLGISLGIANPALLAMFPAVNADFVLPGYPTLLAAIEFDRTGSTRIGRFVFNHSFILPGFAAIGTAIAAGFLMIRFWF